MPRLMHGDASWHYRANPTGDPGAGWRCARGRGPVAGDQGTRAPPGMAQGGTWQDPPPPYLPPLSRSRGGRRRSSDLLLGEESEEERSTSRCGGGLREVCRRSSGSDSGVGGEGGLSETELLDSGECRGWSGSRTPGRVPPRPGGCGSFVVHFTKELGGTFNF